MYKVGISSCGNKPLDESGLREIKNAGISAVEVALGTTMDGVDFGAIRTAADKVGIELWSVHSHMRPDFDISSLDNDSNRAAISELSELINRASAFGLDKFVIHPTHTPEPFDQTTRGEKIKHAMACLDTLAEFAYKKNAVIAVENLPRTCLANTVEEHLQILKANDKLRVCFDFNHSLIDDTADAVRKLGKKIVTVHVSDRDNINERHWLPGEGVLDWNAVMDAFDEIGYEGVWMYEMGLDAPITIERRPLVYKDFADNAKALFERRTPPYLGTPKPNLGLWAPQ